jgi:hypothetical protein
MQGVMVSGVRLVFGVMLVALAGCGSPPRQDSGSTASTDAAVSDSPLEQAALESGVVADARHMSPIGLYRNRHEAGRDSLCIISDPEHAEKMRFGMQAMFGDKEHCAGQGSVRAVGDKLIFHFARSTCLIVAEYQGDRISLPGALDVKCAYQCSDRATLEGVSFPRVPEGVGSPYAERDREGALLCPK